jgi:lycopene cyclase domain-containing protein
MKHYSYLILHLITLAGPVLSSFDKKLRFFNRWNQTIVPILLVGTVFVIWDIIFTSLGIWGFSSEFVLGLYCFNLPIEEVLFFVSVPFCVLFLYEVAGFYQFAIQVPRYFYYGIQCVLIGTAAIFYERIYTLSVVTVSLILMNVPFTKRRSSVIAGTYLLHLPGFLLINGVLTSFPIVWYNTSHISGFRLGSIPCEDLLYSFMLIWGTVYLYDQVSASQTTNTAKGLLGKSNGLLFCKQEPVPKAKC